MPSEKHVGRVIMGADSPQLVVVVKVAVRALVAVVKREQERIDHEIGSFFFVDRAVHRSMASSGSDRSRYWCID